MNAFPAQLATAVVTSLLVVFSAHAEPLADPAQPSGARAEAPAFGGPLLADGHLDLLLRHYAEQLRIAGIGERRSWIQAARLAYQSGFTDGVVGLGVDATLFAGVKLDGGRGDGNMVRVDRDASGQPARAWIHPGEYALKVRIARAIMKIGLQTVINPFLEPYDNRAFPPTFRGWSAIATPATGVAVSAGSFDAVNNRNAVYQERMSTVAAGVAFDRLSYLGVDVHWAERARLAVYASRQADLWDRYYLSAARSFGAADTFKWLVRSDGYATRGQGEQRAGALNTNAYSASVTASRGASSLMLSYQRINGDYFFDYVKETSGIYLENAMGTDYNAPHERSLQLRYKFDGKAAGVPGFQMTLWAVRGTGADGRAQALQRSQPGEHLHDLYWTHGQPIGGWNKEHGAKLVYLVQNGKLKDTKFGLFMMKHTISANYPSFLFTDVRLTIETPIRLF